MATERRYTYETTLDLGQLGERDVKVTFECPDHELAEGVEVVSVERCGILPDDLLARIAAQIEAEHQDHMIQKAYVEDAEAHAEHLDRLDEQKAERAGWRV